MPRRSSAGIGNGWISPVLKMHTQVLRWQGRVRRRTPRIAELSRLCAIVLVAPLAFAPAGGAMGADPEVVLQCPANAPDPDALCAALSAALETVLQDAKSTRHIRQSQIPPTDSSQTAGADTLRLVLSDIRRDRISGHLTWQSGDGSLRTGPEVALDVMDTALSAKMYPRFARGLLQASPEIIKDLSD